MYVFRVSMQGILRHHLLDVLIAEHNFVDRVSAVLEGNVVVVHVGRQEDLGVPGEALAGRKV